MVTVKKSLPATTTAQEDTMEASTKKGQRRVNLIWEFTQGVIALVITGSVVYCAVNKIESEVLTNAFFLIVSMYFVRTNHQLVGGTGIKLPNERR